MIPAPFLYLERRCPNSRLVGPFQCAAPRRQSQKECRGLSGWFAIPNGSRVVETVQGETVMIQSISVSPRASVGSVGVLHAHLYSVECPARPTGGKSYSSTKSNLTDRFCGCLRGRLNCDSPRSGASWHVSKDH